jgi:hypothetical protein
MAILHYDTLLQMFAKRKKFSDHTYSFGEISFDNSVRWPDGKLVPAKILNYISTKIDLLPGNWFRLNFDSSVREIRPCVYEMAVNGEFWFTNQYVPSKCLNDCILVKSDYLWHFLNAIVTNKIEPIYEEPKPERKRDMKKQHMMHLLQTGYTTAAFTYGDGSRAYVFKVRDEDIEALKLSGLALVNSNITASFSETEVKLQFELNQFKVVRLLEVHEEPQIDDDAAFEYKWIAAVVSLEGFKAQAIKENEFKKNMRIVERETARQQAIAAFHANAPAEGSAREAYVKAMQAIGALPSMNTFSNLEAPKPVEDTKVHQE